MFLFKLPVNTPQRTFRRAYNYQKNISNIVTISILYAAFSVYTFLIKKGEGLSCISKCKVETLQAWNNNNIVQPHTKHLNQSGGLNP